MGFLGISLTTQRYPWLSMNISYFFSSHFIFDMSHATSKEAFAPKNSTNVWGGDIKSKFVGI